MIQSKVIGLTGGIASGKSTVSKYMASKNLPIVDADLIARQVVEPNTQGLRELVNEFGHGILNGEFLNRQALRDIAFHDVNALKKLNAILHPIIHDEIVKQLNDLKGKETLIVFDVPLLFENHLEHMVDEIWVVAVKKDTQIKRLMVRDACSKEQASAIIEKQMSLDEKLRKANEVIWNEGTIDDLYKAIDILLINQG